MRKGWSGGSVVDPDPKLFAGSGSGSGYVIINFGSGSYELQILGTKLA